MIDDLFSADIQAAARDRIARPLPPAPAEPSFSAWKMATAVPRGVNEALVQVAATGADIAGSFRAMRDATPEQRRQMARTGAPIESYSSEAGDELRKFGREFRPDPATAHAAEQVVYGFSRGATKIVGGALAAGPVGVLAAGVEEAVTQADELRLQGVDFNARTKAGAVQGAGLALAALPIVGQSAAATAGLYAVGGPGGFIAQQALTREILQNAGYEKIGAQFDPFDPVGVIMASAIPLPFVWKGRRDQKIARAVDSLPDLPPRTDAAPPAEPAAPVPIPSRPSAVAQAVRAYPTEVIDAAHVALLTERRAAANPGAADNLRAMDQHEAALSRAEDQIAAGEQVQVADVAPAARAPMVETPEFLSWFDGSRLVTPEGAPLVLYHGTRAAFDSFDPKAKQVSGDVGRLGTFFTESPQYASAYAADLRGAVQDGGQVLPVYVSIKNPKVESIAKMEDIETTWDKKQVAAYKKSLIESGHDGIVFRGDGSSEFVAFRPEQIKSAIGNSGAFDPTTGSLTDSPYATWADQITAAIREMQAQARPTDAPTTPQAANPEAAAPARSAGEPPAAAGAADAGRPAGVEAAGLTPDQARAAVETAKADVIALRKRESVLNSLLECLTNG